MCWKKRAGFVSSQFGVCRCQFRHCHRLLISPFGRIAVAVSAALIREKSPPNLCG